MQIAQRQSSHTLTLLSPNPLQVFSMPLNAVHHDEGEVAFITLQELLATAASSSTPPTFFICSAPFFFLLLPLTMDWSNKY
jgi:hypothetical protein